MPQTVSKESATDKLTREEVYAILSRHRGEANKLAGQLHRSRTQVSNVLRGLTDSKPILDAAHKRALELLAQERAEKAA